ncbi:MAG: glycosyltransferase family 4 protein [Lentisphaerae bacterium]|nr:glycosyltransferase family 4 protein [Lentisphaerota bacterium]MCP4103596.1 glycosyltransferase family 4 protein [Lentisphaerota bacterium]
MYSILVSATSFDNGKSGVSVYINNCLRELAILHRIEVLAFSEDIPLMPQSENIIYTIASERYRKPAVNMLWHLFYLPFKVKWKKYDFILLPAANRRALCFSRKVTVGVVHDLSQYHVDCKYDPLRMFYIKKILPHYVRKLDSVVAVSNSTAADLKKYWKIPGEKITVNYNGYDRQTFAPVNDSEELQAVRCEYSLDKDFILYISRIEHPGKNHIGLIKAYEMLPEEIRGEYDLILAGSDWSGAEVVREYAVNSSCSDSIKFIDFVENSKLPALMSAASLYVFPSFFEGFGLSVAEAMACELPVACSRTSSLGEIGGDAAIQFEPDNHQEIADCILKVLTDGNIRENLIRAGNLRKEMFNWRKHAEKLIACYENAKVGN